MADTKRGRLGVSTLSAATNTAVYEVTSAMDSLVNIYITNPIGGDALVNIAIVDGAAGDLATEDYILYQEPVPQYGEKTISNVRLNADEAVVAYSSLAGVVVRVDGVEEDEAGSSVLPSIQKVSSGTLTFDDFTDNDNATGYIDFANDLSAGAVPLGWKATITTAFDSANTSSALIQVGVDGDLDRFSSVTDQSVNAAGTVGSGVPADAVDGIAAAQTPRVTITEDSDFTEIDQGEMTIDLYYIATA